MLGLLICHSTLTVSYHVSSCVTNWKITLLIDKGEKRNSINQFISSSANLGKEAFELCMKISGNFQIS